MDAISCYCCHGFCVAIDNIFGEPFSDSCITWASFVRLIAVQATLISQETPRPRRSCETPSLIVIWRVSTQPSAFARRPRCHRGRLGWQPSSGEANAHHQEASAKVINAMYMPYNSSKQSIVVQSQNIRTVLLAHDCISPSTSDKFFLLASQNTSNKKPYQVFQSKLIF